MDASGVAGLGARADAAWLRVNVGGADRLLERQRSFTEALGRHGVGAAAGRASESPKDGSEDARDAAPSSGAEAEPPDADKPDERARRAAEQFVAGVFIQPVLKEMRSQNHAAAPFGPTDAEKALGPLMDAELADRIVRSQRFGLVERIARDLEGRAKASASARPAVRGS